MSGGGSHYGPLEEMQRISTLVLVRFVNCPMAGLSIVLLSFQANFFWGKECGLQQITLWNHVLTWWRYWATDINPGS